MWHGCIQQSRWTMSLHRRTCTALHDLAPSLTIPCAIIASTSSRGGGKIGQVLSVPSVTPLPFSFQCTPATHQVLAPVSLSWRLLCLACVQDRPEVPGIHLHPSSSWCMKTAVLWLLQWANQASCFSLLSRVPQQAWAPHLQRQSA
jgi:hypothetical protein